MTDLKAVRAKAWATRRAMYGETGHSHRAYVHGQSSAGACPDCERMRSLIARLYAEGVLSEGQAAKATGLGRVELRERADAIGDAQ